MPLTCEWDRKRTARCPTHVLKVLDIISTGCRVKVALCHIYVALHMHSVVRHLHDICAVHIRRKNVHGHSKLLVV